MKILNIETREEPDSIAYQLLLIILSTTLMALSGYIIFEIVSGEDIRLIGTLIGITTILIAMIIWAFKRGILAEEIVTGVEVGGAHKVEATAQESVATEKETSTTKDGSVKFLILAIVVAGITAAMVYQVSGAGYRSTITELATEIKHQETKIIELESSMIKLQEGVAVPPPENEIVCTLCHDINLTKTGHSMENLVLLRESRGKTPLICTTCHGASPHNVHNKKLQSGALMCNSCHLTPEGNYYIPKTPAGRILVCEACHAYSGRAEDVGNYIAIHIEEGKRDCDICHLGDPIKIHNK